jgi:dual specificity MAP kinase phosphatase
MGVVFSLNHSQTSSTVPSKSIMPFIYEKQTLTPLSFLEFIRAPVSFSSRPLVFCEPFDGLPPPCTAPEEQISYLDSHRIIHQTFRVTPYQFKTHRLWLFTSHTISHATISEVLEYAKTFPFQDFTSFEAVDTALFIDLKPFGSFASGMRPPSAGFRGSSPVRVLPLLDSAEPLHVRRSQQATLQTTFGNGPIIEPLSRIENDIDEIEDRLFIGNERAARDPILLKGYGITHIVNLNGNEGGAHFPESFQYRKVNLNDGEFEELDRFFWDAVKFVSEAIKRGGRVFIHCRRGISRSAALALAYLIEAKEMSFDRALEQLKQRRPVININAGFLEQIRSRARKHRVAGKRFLPGLAL